MSTLYRGFPASGMHLSRAQRATHTHVVGQPGTGKSRTLESWVMQDILAGQGLAVIDPHGELYRHLILRIGELMVKEPELAERVVLVDPTDKVWTVGFNPLHPIPGIPQERLAGFLTDVIVKIWKLDAAQTPRMLRLLTHTFLALSEAGLGLVDLPRFLRDDGYRNRVVGRTRYREVAEYFRFEFPQKGSAVHQWVTPALNKIGPLIFDPDVKLMLAAGSTISFREILDRNLILMVNLPKGILGEGNSALLGAFIVAHLQQAALARADGRRADLFFLYLDEFQNYTTDNIQDILSESRKYGLSLVMAHQYLEQLSGGLREAVLNTAGTLVCFRVGYEDATRLAREVFPPGSIRETRPRVDFVRIGLRPMPYFRQVRQALPPDALVAQLTQLRPREFWTKVRGAHQPTKHRSLEMPAPVESRELWRARKLLVDTSGNRYGRLKVVVRQEENYERIYVGESATTYYEDI